MVVNLGVYVPLNNTNFSRIASAHELDYMVVNLGVYVPLNNTNFSRVASAHELDYMVVNLGAYGPLFSACQVDQLIIYRFRMFTSS